jgi:hypothetical protein
MSRGNRSIKEHGRSVYHMSMDVPQAAMDLVDHTHANHSREVSHLNLEIVELALQHSTQWSSVYIHLVMQVELSRR